MKINNIYLGDCIIIMEREIIKNSIDLVYADPPYNLSGKIILHVKMEKLQSVIKVHGIR